jgi:NAD(P)-dependent dehydrogenase (short-subunit alcohol dehydrogenase family)
VSPTDATPNPLERFDLTGCTAIVTGATRGLGRAIVTALAAQSRHRDRDRRPRRAGRPRRRSPRQPAPSPCLPRRPLGGCDALVEAAYEEFGDRRAREQRGSRRRAPTPQG